MATTETCTGYELEADIDLDVAPHNAGSGWDPIDGFEGAFEGNNHTIRGLFIDRGDEDGVGLFGSHTGASTTIRNIALAGVNVTGGSRVGAVAGQVDNELVNVVAGGKVTSATADATQVGGLAGSAASISGSLSAVHVVAGAVSGQSVIGGLAGSVSAGVSDSYAVGSVVGLRHRRGQCRRPCRQRGWERREQLLARRGERPRGRDRRRRLARRRERDDDRQLLGHVHQRAVGQRGGHGPGHQRPPDADGAGGERGATPSTAGTPPSGTSGPRASTRR